jgi:hypothetical protein
MTNSFTFVRPASLYLCVLRVMRGFAEFFTDRHPTSHFIALLPTKSFGLFEQKRYIR